MTKIQPAPDEARPERRVIRAAARSPAGTPLEFRLVLTLCLAAIAIGVIVLIGYALGSASMAALGTDGKPAAAVSALVFVVLGVGLLALRWPLLTGLLTPRRAALALIVIAAASLVSAALSRNIDEWQLWAARGGVYFHAFPITALLILALGSALALVTTRWDLAGHLIASSVLLICIVFLFGYVLHVPSFLDPLGRLAPVAVTTSALTLLSAATVLVRPRGWVVPLLSRTSAGAMLRLVLPAIVVVPFFSLTLNRWLTDDLGHNPQVGLTAVVAVNVFFAAALLLGAGAALHRRESDRLRLAAIVESSDEAIIGASSDGLIESWNGGAERMYGYTAAEVIGRSVSMLAPPERDDDAPRILERIRRGERIDPFETVRITRDGRRVDVLMGVSPALDEDGNVVGVSTITHDITGRKQAGEGLARVSERLALATRAAHLGIWDWDVVHDRLVWDDGMYALYGVKKEDFGGAYQAWLAGLHPDDRARSEDESRLALSGGSEYASEFRVVWPDGTVHYLATQGAVVRDEGGRPLRLVGVNSDITEQRSVEEALRQRSESLELSGAELERFNRLAVGRELRMIELKRQINELCVQLGQPAPHVLPQEHAVAKETS